VDVVVCDLVVVTLVGGVVDEAESPSVWPHSLYGHRRLVVATILLLRVYLEFWGAA